MSNCILHKGTEYKINKTNITCCIHFTQKPHDVGSQPFIFKHFLLVVAPKLFVASES